MPYLDENKNPGDPISASEQSELHRMVNRQSRTRGGRGIAVTHSLAGVLISLTGIEKAHLTLGVVTEVMGDALDGEGRGLGAGTWYKVKEYGKHLDEEAEVEPERIMRAFQPGSPALLFAWEVGQRVPLMIVPREGEEIPREVWIIAGEAYDSELCEEA